jgi:hypothetical protein
VAFLLATCAPLIWRRRHPLAACLAFLAAQAAWHVALYPSDVWDILPEDTQKRALHFAPYPEDLCKIPMLATCPEGGTVLDVGVGQRGGVAAPKRGRSHRRVVDHEQPRSLPGAAVHAHTLPLGVLDVSNLEVRF